jgi:hypothetical protein
MKIDDDCAKAFLNGKSFCRGNTLVSTGIMTLFGNMIAIKTNNVIKSCLTYSIQLRHAS